MRSCTHNHPAFAAIILITFSLTLSARMVAQEIDIRTNLLYWLTTTPNVGFDVSLGEHLTLGVSGGYNAFNLPDLSLNGKSGLNSKLHHWAVMPDLRWWFSAPYKGSYIAFHLLGGEFNAGGIPFPKFLSNHRYRGNAMGAGLSYGCDWRVGGRWRIGVSTGLSWVRLDYNRYNCGSCGIRNGHYVKNLGIITPVGVTLSYIISGGQRYSTSSSSISQYIRDNMVNSFRGTFSSPVDGSGSEEPTDPSISGISIAEDKTKHDTLRLTLRYDVDRAELSDREISRLDTLISSIKGRHITGVTIKGYASPEYDDDHNRILSAKRASNVADRLIYTHNLPDCLIKAEGRGDDWEGLLRLASDIRGVRMVIETYHDGNERKRAMLKLGNYHKILSTFYPLLRRAEVIIFVE